MRTHLILLSALILPWFSCASEPGFVRTHQPLGNLANGDICVTAVLGVSKNAYSDDDGTQAINLIHKPYNPPCDLDEPSGDHNLASTFNIRFAIVYQADAKPSIVLDASGIVAEDSRRMESRIDVVRATLECLRLSTPQALRKAAITLKAKKEDELWLAPLVADYNKHDKSKPFYSQKSR